MLAASGRWVVPPGSPFLENLIVEQVVRETTQVGENETTIVEMTLHDRPEVPDQFRAVIMA